MLALSSAGPMTQQGCILSLSAGLYIVTISRGLYWQQFGSAPASCYTRAALASAGPMMGLVLVYAFSGFTLISIYVEKLYSINQPSTQPVTAYIETADFGVQTDRFVVVMLPWKLCRAFQVQIFTWN